MHYLVHKREIARENYLKGFREGFHKSFCKKFCETYPEGSYEEKFELAKKLLEDFDDETLNLKADIAIKNRRTQRNKALHDELNTQI